MKKDVKAKNYCEDTIFFKCDFRQESTSLPKI